MATEPSSRADRPATLVDLIQAIRQTDLPDRRRQELISAVNTVARILNRSVGEIHLDPRLLANRLAEVSPAAVDLSAGRWANAKSLFRAALSLVRDISPGRHLSSLSPEWQALWEHLPGRTAKTRLSRFMHFASANGIVPDEVTAETFTVFRSYLDTSLLRDPDRTYCATIDGWKVARSIVGWPQVALVRPNRHRTWALPWAQFPSTLRDDVEAWLDRLSGDDLMADGPARPVRPITKRSHLSQLHRFASAVVLSGRDAATVTSLGDLILTETFAGGLTYLLRVRQSSPGTVRNTAGILKAIARHHVGADQRQLDKMAAIIKRIGPAQRGLTAKNRERLRPLNNPKNVQALLGITAKLMQLAEREDRPHKAAYLAQTAVAIEILEMTLMRIKNLVSLDIDKHFRRTGNAGSLWIVIKGDEIKNSQPQEFPLHPQSVALIDRYLTKYRPILNGNSGSALFPGKKGGGPKHVNSLADQVKRAVLAHAGLVWNPHLFRHAGAKLHLDEKPGTYGLPRRVLGHRSETTLERFYSGEETAAAVREFDRNILKLRDRSSPTGES